MIQPGDVVATDFPGVQGTKRRPCIVLSSDLYHTNRPDVILAVLTTQLRSARTPTDYLLQDWEEAGLDKPSAARMFLATRPSNLVEMIGHLSERDWREVQARAQLALALS
jgi:mRNA interferase MazF